MKQTTLVSTGFERRRRTTHRAQHRGLGRQLFAAVSQQLRAAGMKLSVGTIVDASIISAPSWIRTKEHSRDPDRRQLGAPEASLP